MGKLSVQDLTAILVEKNGLDQEEARRFVSTIFDIIQENVEKDKLVKVKGLGTFKIIEVEARESINVNTGERVLIDGHSKVTFTPDATMKELVNKPFSSFETVALNDGVEFVDTPTPKSSKESNKDDDDEADDTQNEVSEEPVEAVEQPKPAPVVDQPKPAPVVDQPKPAPVAEQPKPAPVVEEPKPAPVIEEPKPTPVVEQPIEEPVQEPVAVQPKEEPVVVETPSAVQPKEEPIKVEKPVTTPTQQAIKDAVIELGAQKKEPVQTEEEVEEEEEEESHGTQWGTLVLGLLIGLIVGCVVGFYVYKKDIMSYFYPTTAETTEEVEQVEQPTPLVTDSLVASTDTTKVDSTSADTVQLGTTVGAQSAAQSEKPAAEPVKPAAESAKPAAKSTADTDEDGFNYKKYEAMDARVRTGAYYIAGTDQIVAAREGDTVERISRRYLGAGLSCYVEVYNELGGKTVLKEGQTIKIPKLKLKKYLKKK